MDDPPRSFAAFIDRLRRDFFVGPPYETEDDGKRYPRTIEALTLSLLDKMSHEEVGAILADLYQQDISPVERCVKQRYTNDPLSLRDLFDEIIIAMVEIAFYRRR